MSKRRRPSTPSNRRKSVDRTERRKARDERRRQFARHASVQQARQARRRRQVRIATIALAVVIIGGAAFVLIQWRTGGPTSYSLTADVVDNPQGDLAVSTPPTSYHAVYRIDSYDDSGSPTTSTEDFIVQRPYNGKTVGKSGAPPGGDEQWNAVSNLGVYSQGTAGSAPQVNQAAPHTAIGDLRLDASLDDLVAKGTFVKRERRSVLGRECQVYRTGQSLQSFSVAAPTSKDYADACIDADGMLLEEVAVKSGALSERLIATEVDDQTAPASDAFVIQGAPLPLAQGGSELLGLDVNTAPTNNYWVLDAPEGYQHIARYLVREPAPDSADASAPTTTTTPGQQPATKDTYADVYASGANSIVVEQGLVANEPETDATNGAEVTVGTLGTAHVTPGLTGNSLAVYPTTAENWFVHITATLPSTQLQQIANAIHT